MINDACFSDSFPSRNAPSTFGWAFTRFEELRTSLACEVEVPIRLARSSSAERAPRAAHALASAARSAIRTFNDAIAFSIAITSSNNRSAPCGDNPSTRSSRSALCAEVRMIPNTFRRSSSPATGMEQTYAPGVTIFGGARGQRARPARSCGPTAG